MKENKTLQDFAGKETSEQEKRKEVSLKWLWLTGGVIGFLVLCFAALVGVRYEGFRKLENASALTPMQWLELESSIRENPAYVARRQILQPLPYTFNKPELSVGAESAILVDVASGNILYEKNADEVIPPASMTKLFAMYVVDEEVSAGNLRYDDVIPLPPESWACNMPPHSSLMFLGKGQRVTLEELLLGLSICSGNDAAYALAYTICGTMEAFVERMNQVAEDLGLVHTHFVESSGYSELNTTTAREMATFARVYLKNHPDSLARYHGVESFTYPKVHNLAPGDRLEAQDFTKGFPEHITMPITQKNTNPLLGRLAGCDGLKTGYIDESGYNLALTCKRGGTRFLSVTMRGQGNNTYEGQQGRIHDGTEMMEWAFYSFADFTSLEDVRSYFTKVLGAKQKGVNLVPAFDVDAVCVPFVTGESAADGLNDVTVKVDVPGVIFGGVQAGAEYGKVTVMVDGITLDTIPLIAECNIEKSNLIVQLADKVVRLISSDF